MQLRKRPMQKLRTTDHDTRCASKCSSQNFVATVNVLRFADHNFLLIKWTNVKVPGVGGRVHIKYRFWQCLGGHTGISSCLLPHGFLVKVGASVPVCLLLATSKTLWRPQCSFGFGAGLLLSTLQSLNSIL